MPFGGVKCSGIGVEFGEEGLLEYTTIQDGHDSEDCCRMKRRPLDRRRFLAALGRRTERGGV